MVGEKIRRREDRGKTKNMGFDGEGGGNEIGEAHKFSPEAHHLR